MRSSYPICSINSRGPECNDHRRPLVPPQPIPKIWRTSSTIGRGWFSWEFYTFFNLHVWTYLLPETIGLVGYFLVYYVGKLNQSGETPQAQITLLFFCRIPAFRACLAKRDLFFCFVFSFRLHAMFECLLLQLFTLNRNKGKGNSMYPVRFVLSGNLFGSGVCSNWVDIFSIAKMSLISVQSS